MSDIHRYGPAPSTETIRSNPVSRVSVALSKRLCAGGTGRMKKLQKHALTGGERGKWQRDNTLLTGLCRIVRETTPSIVHTEGR